VSLATFETPTGPVELRHARAEDVLGIVAMLHDDQIAADRDSVREAEDEDEDEAVYLAAFARIEADPSSELLVLTDTDGTLVGTLQFTVLPGLSRRGSSRAQLEAVRIDSARRGGGLGSQFIGWALEEARRRGCGHVQLTSDARRVDARRFYERLGFVASHVGMKREL
jgi:GNAT superfamily N-acetyltransferase